MYIVYICTVKGVSVCEEGEGECQDAVDKYMHQLDELIRYSLPKGNSVAGKDLQNTNNFQIFIKYKVQNLNIIFINSKVKKSVCF